EARWAAGRTSQRLLALESGISQANQPEFQRAIHSDDPDLTSPWSGGGIPICIGDAARVAAIRAEILRRAGSWRCLLNRATTPCARIRSVSDRKIAILRAAATRENDGQASAIPQD